jgi:hypothetical protein
MLTGNVILDELQGSDRESFLALLEKIELNVRDVVAPAESLLETVIFPMTCVLSTTSIMQSGDEVEVAGIGYEGFFPLGILLGAKTCENQTVCQVAGEAMRIGAAEFRSAFDRFPSLRTLTQRFAQGALTLMSQSIACNRLHPLLERCARWLLVMDDRVRGEEFRITQEYLAIMLGVRRPAVSVAAQTLQHAGLISYRRGTMKVVDRAGLEASSCECHRVVARTYERLLGAQ